jgi:hypothetical protein
VSTERRPAWVPARPDRDVAVWETAREGDRRGPAHPAEGGAPEREGDEPAPEDDLGRTGPRRAAGGRRRPAWWTRASRGRRLALAYGALALAAVLPAALLTPGQPGYGADAPWQGVATVDLREAPTTGWSVALAETLAPGSRPACLRFPTATVGSGRVLVSAGAGWTYGFANDAGCGSETTGVGSRLALLDTDRGDFAWVHDLADDATRLGLEGPVDVAAASLAGDTGLVVVRVVAGEQAVLLTLSIDDGRTVGSSAATATTENDRFEASGTVVATGSQPTPGVRYRYELRDVRDLTRVTWAGLGTTNGTVLALDDRLVVATPDGTVQVDAASGVARPWGSRLDRLTGHLVHEGSLIGPSGAAGGVTARSADGSVRWRSPGDVRGALDEGRSCLLVTDVTRDRLTCLSWRTGEVTWTRSGLGSTGAAGVVGQTDDRVYATSSSAGDGPLEVEALDGATGRTLARFDLPTGAVLAAVGRTVGYALAYGSSGGRSTVVAVDLATGERLWTHTGQLQVAIWAGHPVDVDVEGRADELTVPEARVVPGS